MISSEFRAEARKKLSGKWKTAVCMTLVYILLMFAITFIENHIIDSMFSIFSLITIVVEVPLSFGLLYAFLKLYNDEEVGYLDFFTLGFNNFKKSWGITLQAILKMIIPIILIIISYAIIFFSLVMTLSSIMLSAESASFVFSFSTIIGSILLLISSIWAITKYYHYQLSYIIAIDNPDLSSKEAVLKSKELMTNNRAKLFFLELSFIGWAILAAISFGIGLLWLIPYIQFSVISFYKYLLENKKEH